MAGNGSVSVPVKGIIDKYMEGHWLRKENANHSTSLGAMEFFMSSEISSQFYLNYVFHDIPEVARLHNEGYIHIHNIQRLSLYCVGISAYDLAIKGFNSAVASSKTVRSNPPKHLDTFCI